MRLAVFSDVHGNLPALEIMLKHAGPVDGYISLGDVVNYGPWSNECVDLVGSLPNTVLLAGNHERYFVEGRYDGSNGIARAFFDFCYPTFGRQDAIKGLPETYELNGFHFAHTIQGRYIYADTELVLDDNYVIGHSHHPFNISQPPFALYNPGSVGQNRKYINVINYLLLETDTMAFTQQAVTYNERLIIDEMIARKYPQQCIDYYDRKQRLTN